MSMYFDKELPKSQWRLISLFRIVQSESSSAKKAFSQWQSQHHVLSCRIQLLAISDCIETPITLRLGRAKGTCIELY